METLRKKDPLYLNRKDKKVIAGLYGAVAASVIGGGLADQMTPSQAAADQLRTREAIVQPLNQEVSSRLQEVEIKQEHGGGKKKVIVDNVKQQVSSGGSYPDYKHTPEYQQKFQYLSALLYGEADDKSELEQRFIFSVVLNRMKSKQFLMT
jgi:spore germination cell wall hydrolase CwlJ-like protein